VTFWWDASQIYGWDAITSERVRNPEIRHLLKVNDKNELPPNSQQRSEFTLDLHPHEMEQEVTAFTHNWWVGLSVLNTAFVREHNRFTKKLWQGAQQPSSLIRNQLKTAGVHFENLNDAKVKLRVQEQIFQIGRLYISALIAKIHTIEWTPQLIFNPVTDAALNANWIGLNKYLAQGQAQNAHLQRVSKQIDRITSQLKKTRLARNSSLLAAVTGIVRADTTAAQFGSPFALPEEFTTVYRLHPLLPDFIELYSTKDLLNRKSSSQPQAKEVGTSTLSRESARKAYTTTTDSLADFALSLGIQEVGTLQLNNYPMFLQQLEVPQMLQGTGLKNSDFKTPTIDLAAVDILRDRERGIPRFNRFRQEIGLVPFNSFNDFLDRENALDFFLACDSDVQSRFEAMKGEDRLMAKAYDVFEKQLGIETVTQLYNSCVSQNSTASQPNKERGLTAGRTLLAQLSERNALMKVYTAQNAYDGDALDRVDTLVGIFAENTRPHGFALSETQFHIFILNASRRLFSDRFFTSSYNKETYTQFALDELEYRDMRHVLADNFPELRPLLVEGSSNGETSKSTKFKIPNAFDPWNRESKDGYALSGKRDWKILLQ
jgi:hypothetical protein